MAGATTNFGIAFFDFGDALDSRINAQKEIDRFVLIDEQLFGLYSIFGNGVVNGWNLTTTGDLSVTIAPGVGIANALACETDFPISVTNLPANSTVTIYAATQGSTTVNRAVTFDYSKVAIPDGAIPLASVTTGDTQVTNIDTTSMQVIGFQQIIDYEVAHHHHTGSPPKIQLDAETRGLLPGSRIAALDASILQSGKINIGRITQLNHNQLANVGFLTHPQIDSLLGSIQRDNEQLLGEISSVNLMKAAVFQKYVNPDADEYFVNELAMIPGVSHDSFIDWDNTTANVDKVHQCISGLPPQLILPTIGNTGATDGELSIVTVIWQTDADFQKANVISNLRIENGVFLLSDTVQNLVVEDFETVTNGPAGGYAGSLVEDTTVAASYDRSTSAQGFYSGKFETKHTYHSAFKKTYAAGQDWSNYNELVVYVKSYSASHAAVYLKITDTSGNDITTLTLLATDETTSTGNLPTGGFAQKIFSLDGLSLKGVGSVTVYTDDITTNDEIFYLDNVYLQNTDLLLPQGTLRLRYSSATPVIFRSIDYIADIPVGCDFRVRQRAGNTVQDMLAAPFGTRLNAGDVFATVGREIEIDVTFYADATQTKTPLLTYVELQLLVQSEDAGFTIKDAGTFSRGDFENTLMSTAPDGEAFVQMQYTNVGDMYFLYEGIVNEIDPSLIPQFGVNGSQVPVSPLQGHNSLNGSPSLGFTDARSVYRLNNANYLVADTGNDRVIETKPDGTFVRGFGSHNRDYDTTVYAVSAVYNPVVGKLYVAFSMQVALETYDLTQVHINYGGNILTLDNSSDIRQTLLTVPLKYDPLATSVTLDRILCVELSGNHQNLLKGVTDQLYVQLDSDPNLNYIPCFNGDFIYYGRGAIIRPVYLNQIESGKWVIGNSQVFHGYDDILTGQFKGASPPGVQSSDDALADFKKMLNASTSVLSIIDDTATAKSTQALGTTDFTYNNIAFSDITLGGVWPVGNGKLLIAGIRLIPPSPQDPNATGGIVNENQDNTPAGVQVSNATGTTSVTLTDTKRMTGYQGVVTAVDKATGRILFTYESPEGLYPSDVFVDDNGLYVVAETSLIPQAGRIIRLDRYGNISAMYSDGMYTKINDIRKLSNNHMLVST